MTTADDLFDLLPAHLRTRDEGGLLAAVLDAVAGEASVLDADLRELYDDWFVETAAEWVLPYLGDLLGIDDLPDVAGKRALVANTIDYRRRKGTVAAAEQIARDVGGDPSRVVEYLRLLSVSAHLNHLRLERPGTADIRHADERSAHALASGALDPTPHTIEARRIASGRGRYGIGNVGVFTFPTTIHRVDQGEATGAGDFWWVHPLGLSRPLFAPPETETAIEHLATESDLAVPLRPRRLLGLLRNARRPQDTTQLPVSVALETAAGRVELDPHRVRAMRLEDLTDDGSAPGGWHAMVDAVAGRVAVYRDGTRVTPTDAGAPRVLVTHAYGGRRDVGADPGDHRRLHERALSDGAYTQKEGDAFGIQRAVALAAGDDPSAAIAEIESAWATDPELAGRTSAVSFGDSGTWAGSLAITIPPATRLIAVAADWRMIELPDGSARAPAPGAYAPGQVRPVIVGDVAVRAGAGGALLVDGLTIIGDLEVEADGMTLLVLSQTTVTGSIRVRHGAGVGAGRLAVRILHSAVGGVDLAPEAPALQIETSIVSAEVGGSAMAAEAIAASGAHLDIRAATIRGGVAARTLSCTDVLFDGFVDILHRQVHCARYSSFGDGSRTPRRFRCVTEGLNRPAYLSVGAGDPGFLALSDAAPQALREGSETGDEIGVDAAARAATTIAAARRLVAATLPVGVDSYVWTAR